LPPWTGRGIEESGEVAIIHGHKSELEFLRMVYAWMQIVERELRNWECWHRKKKQIFVENVHGLPRGNANVDSVGSEVTKWKMALLLQEELLLNLMSTVELSEGLRRRSSLPLRSIGIFWGTTGERSDIVEGFLKSYLQR
jgi:hypothetical protein